LPASGVPLASDGAVGALLAADGRAVLALRLARAEDCQMPSSGTTIRVKPNSQGMMSFTAASSPEKL
jgi:hypothetical protein